MSAKSSPILYLIPCLSLFAQTAVRPPLDMARAAWDALQRSDITAFSAMESPEFHAQVSDDALRSTLATLAQQIGKPISPGGEPSVQAAGAATNVILPEKFEKATLDVVISLDAQGRVIGFHLAPHAETVPPWQMPSYAQPSQFHENPVTVPAGEWKLSGTLSMPEGKRPLPAVVLVHGSGPNDRDESIGPNKIFRDLAWGLASRGVVVLRYEKRTKQFPERSAAITHLTVKDEVIDDAVAALGLLRATPGVDPKRVFVVGHSLGGMLAPRIVDSNPSVAGMILLAGAALPMEDAIVAQTQHLVGLETSLSVEQRNQAISKVKEQAARIKSDSLSVDTPANQLPFGVPASYWLDLRNYHPAELAKKLQKPMLIIQGERDYQVTEADLAIWRNALANRKDVTIKTYPGLNHLLIFGSGEGKSTPAEYDQPGHMAENVIADVAVWVKSH